MKIELSQQFSCDLIREVLAGAVDLAIATEPPEARRLTTVKVAEPPFYIAMSEDDELTFRAFIDPQCYRGSTLGDLRPSNAPAGL